MALTLRLLPREKYGQFLSANHIFGLISLIATPPLCGVLLGIIRDYRYAFAFSAVCTGAAFLVCGALYLQWKKLGGDASFTPPQTSPGG